MLSLAELYRICGLRQGDTTDEELFGQIMREAHGVVVTSLLPPAPPNLTNGYITPQVTEVAMLQAMQSLYNSASVSTRIVYDRSATVSGQNFILRSVIFRALDDAYASEDETV